MRDAREPLRLKIYEWCLMTTHSHFVLEAPDAMAVRRLMRLLAAVVMRCGPQGARAALLPQPFEPAFLIVPLGGDGVLQCMRYVDRNPLEAHVVRRAEDYAWSSYRSRLGLIPCDWLDTPAAFLALGEDEAARRRRYRSFVESGILE